MLRRGIMGGGMMATALALWTSAAMAAHDTGLSEDIFLADMPSVLTASRITQSALDAPAPVTVIDRDMIRASGFTELHELLRLVPGYLVADSPRFGPVVVNHGLGNAFSTRLLVLVDGRSVLEAAAGTVKWQDLHVRPDDIERIEVVRGPNQASYGANAFQGVINLITRTPDADHGEELRVSRGNHGIQDYYARLGQASERFSWRVSASGRESTLFQDFATFDRQRLRSSERQTLHAQAAWRPSLRDELRLNYGLSDGDDKVGSSLRPNDEPYHERGNRNHFVQLAWHRSYAADSEFSLQYYHYSRRERDTFIISAPGLATPISYDVDMRRDDLELQQNHVFTDALKGVWGAGVRQDQVRSEHYYYSQGTLKGTQWQAFGNLDWRFAPRWLLHAGAMVEDHYNTNTLFSPRLALNYAIAPTHALRLSAGRGYRAPTLFESKAHEAVPYLRDFDLNSIFNVPKGTNLNGSLVDLGAWATDIARPETMEYGEIGYVGRFKDYNLQVDTRLFLEEHGGYIDTETCKVACVSADCAADTQCAFALPGNYYTSLTGGIAFRDDKAFCYYNSGDIRVWGGDLTLDWQHPSVGRLRLTHAVTRIEAGTGINNRDTAKSTPRNASSLLWSQSFSWGIRASVSYYYVGDMWWLGDGDFQPSYEKIDLRLAKRLGKAGSDNEIALTLQNVNGRHAEFREVAGSDSVAVERLGFVTLRLGW